MQSWDYGNNGAYFITICTKDREHFFGEIVGTRLIASPNKSDQFIAAHNQFIPSGMGLLAEQYWFEIPNHFPFIELGNFVVMPNHVHGILMIDKPVGLNPDTGLQNPDPPTKTGGFAGIKTP